MVSVVLLGAGSGGGRGQWWICGVHSSEDHRVSVPLAMRIKTPPYVFTTQKVSKRPKTWTTAQHYDISSPRFYITYWPIFPHRDFTQRSDQFSLIAILPSNTSKPYVVLTKRRVVSEKRKHARTAFRTRALGDIFTANKRRRASNSKSEPRQTGDWLCSILQNTV